MIVISNFDDLKYFCLEYRLNSYLKQTVKEYFECLYSDEMSDKNNFNLKEIVNGNSSIIILENNYDINCLMEKIYNDMNNLSWCTNFRVNDDLKMSFYQIGLIIEKSYCSHYFLPMSILDENSNIAMNDLITNTRVIY